MRAPSSYRLTVSELKASTDIVEVARSLTELRRVGNQLAGLCPLHEEWNPSFFVHPQKQVFKCFGCGVGGDVIELVMRASGCSFRAVLEVLAGFSSGVASASGPRSGPRFGASEGAAPPAAERPDPYSQFSASIRPWLLAALEVTNRRLESIKAANQAASAALATACEPDRTDSRLIHTQRITLNGRDRGGRR